MYKVTLAMPIYNVEKYIRQALNSALNQTFDSIEYLLVDDRGSDGSMDIVNEIIQRHDRGRDVKIFEHEVNIGLGGARNTAIDNAQGEFIYFMDSDDEITPDCIRILYEKMMETPVDFVASSYKYISIEGEILKQTIYEDKLIKSGEHAVADAFFTGRNLMSTTVINKLYRLNFLKKNKIKGAPFNFSEDVYFSYQVILNACSCRLLPTMSYYYYEREGSIMGVAKKVRPYQIKQYEEFLFLLRRYIQEYQHCKFYSQLLLRIYYMQMSYSLKIYTSNEISYKEKKYFISNILQNPIPLRKIIKLNHKHYLLPLFVIIQIPSVRFKIFLSEIICAYHNRRSSC
jgi:glycosyltransferase involved in cell wall biosynthesis